ncbi:sulfite exporter TauE/SafE family protein [Acetivibrio mesophilus]|uniref:Probable membrane transporter protein n=1 Tax=Acetivibrio mesophilus TaxID=2487273 RepID=A0A4Q0I6G0_9FIRM|nr:sulfite exporter TauE/SafE family protein [Acetivibrio mesophilus]ODM25007.1 permease [Clostridium sp. Bc-iso-3]RXE59994.1 sulfite exporter TauE/SafE family protein [Acetivibrio mesophilus]HHV29419.1 sulfite exporter TauE/SafE family protein [Clostridium sp.]
MLLFLIGLASGIISGMGIGGGAILIPALVFFVNPDQHIAQSVNLLFFIPTAVIALIVHIKNKRVNFKLTVPIAIFGLIGAFLGSRLAIALPGGSLKKYFGIFLLILGFYEMLRRDKKRNKEQGKEN